MNRARGAALPVPEERRAVLLTAEALLAHRQFDDDGQSDLDMFKVLSLLEKTQRLWHESSKEVSTLLERVEVAEKEVKEMEAKIRRQAAELKDARAQIEQHLTEGSALKAALADYENKFTLVQQLLKDQMANLPPSDREQLDFLSDATKSLTRVHSRAFQVARLNGASLGGETSILDDNIDYDQSDDSLLEDDSPHEIRGRSTFRMGAHRRSQSAYALPGVTSKRSYAKMEAETISEERELEVPDRKRSKEDFSSSRGQTTVTTAVTVDREGREPVRTTVTIRRSMNRSMSASRVLDENSTKSRMPAGGAGQFTPRIAAAASALDVHTPLPGKSWTNGKPIETHRHKFEKLNGFFKMTYCDVCQKGINFAAKPAVRCQHCDLHVHIPCKQFAPMPCVPRPPPGTPKTPAKQKPRLQEFCPPTQPMIPHVLVHCVMALEKNHLNAEGLYRVPGSEKDVRPLLDQLVNSRAPPKMNMQRDPEVITTCVKRFLKNLRDPLIPRSSREEFVRAALTNNMVEMNRAICELPQPNRDTLAYMIVHWQKVAERAAVNKMPIANLARIIGPTVVGERMSTMRNVQQTSAIDDAHEAALTLQFLLEMETVYWKRFLEYDENRELPSYASPSMQKTPTMGSRSVLRNCNVTRETPRAADCSFLGPLDSPSKVAGEAPPLLRPIPRRGKLFDSPS